MEDKTKKVWEEIEKMIEQKIGKSKEERGRIHIRNNKEKKIGSIYDKIEIISSEEINRRLDKIIREDI